jgi:hypothetical protein
LIWPTGAAGLEPATPGFGGWRERSSGVVTDGRERRSGSAVSPPIVTVRRPPLTRMLTRGACDYDPLREKAGPAARGGRAGSAFMFELLSCRQSGTNVVPVAMLGLSPRAPPSGGGPIRHCWPLWLGRVTLPTASPFPRADPDRTAVEESLRSARRAWLQRQVASCDRMGSSPERRRLAPRLRSAHERGPHDHDRLLRVCGTRVPRHSGTGSPQAP